MISQIIGIAFHPLWCWFFCIHMNLKIVGIGIAGCITDGAVFGVNLFYSWYDTELRRGVVMPDSRTFTNLSPILRLGLPNALMMSLDYWTTSLYISVAGYVGVIA